MNLEHQTTNSSPFFWALGKGMGALMGVSTLKRTHSSKSKKQKNTDKQCKKP